MARVRPEPWDENQIRQVEGLLTTYTKDKDTIASVMGCKSGDVDWLCRQAWNMTFEKAVGHFARIGDAQLRTATFKLAMEGNPKILEALNRERGIMMGPVERRRQSVTESKDAGGAKADADNKSAASTLQLIQGRRAGRKTQSA